MKSEADGRLYTKTYERNVKPVIDGLSTFLGDVSGHALEIGSGTGQHIIAYADAFPALIWTPSEPDAIHRQSINAWRAHHNAPTKPAAEIDASSDWAASVAHLSPLRFILSMNVIHIAPFAVARGIVAGAGNALAAGGHLAFYGPFRESGRHTGEGNATFDARLRTDNPDWGVRDVDEIADIAEDCGLQRADLIEMPANNRLLVFRRSERG